MEVGVSSDVYSSNANEVFALRIKQSTGKKLKRVDMKILQRLLMFLYYNGKSKKTNMAMKCGLSYDKCVLYLDWMKAISLIRNEFNQKFELVSLSDRGIEFFEKNFKCDSEPF
jgi:predicted transcriptional regulator